MNGLSLFRPLENEIGAVVEGLRQSVVHVHNGSGHGAGVVWEAPGQHSLIVTNYHLVPGRSARIETYNGRRYPARVVARDANNDLAVLQVEANLPAAQIGDSRSVQVGQLIFAVGHPWGIAGNATLGIISAKGNHLWLGRAQRELLQADVVLAPGNSGGPLADVTGHVVGINSMIVSPGIALAIPSHVVENLIQTVNAPTRNAPVGNASAQKRDSILA